MNKIINNCELGFKGYYFNKVMQCYILGSGYRMFCPKLRVYLSPDKISPFGNAGPNRYHYCKLDPINFSDASGFISISGWWKAIGAIVLGAGAVVLGVAAAVVTFGASTPLSAAMIAFGTMGIIGAIGGIAGAGVGVAALGHSIAGNEAYAEKLANVGLIVSGVSLAISAIAYGGATLAVPASYGSTLPFSLRASGQAVGRGAHYSGRPSLGTLGRNTRAYQGRATMDYPGRMGDALFKRGISFGRRGLEPTTRIFS